MKDSLNVVIVFYPSLMRTLNFPPLEVNMISNVRIEPLVMEVQFKTSHLIPSPNDEASIGMVVPLSIVEFSYKSIQQQTIETE